jgi:hypothetical protein
LGANGKRRSNTTELPVIRIRFLRPDERYEINTDIRDVEVDDHVKTAKWHQLELMSIISRSERVNNLQRVSEIASRAALPDLDKLGRLMRYQTTINRQLSTAVGEVLELLNTRPIKRSAVLSVGDKANNGPIVWRSNELNVDRLQCQFDYLKCSHLQGRYPVHYFHPL